MAYAFRCSAKSTEGGLIRAKRLFAVTCPRIMGDSLELQPLTVIIALMVGGEVGGIAGWYLSVPAVAALRIVGLERFSRPSPISSGQRTPNPLEVA